MKETCKNIDENHTDLVKDITGLLQTLCGAVKEVQVVVERESYMVMLEEKYDPSKERLVEVPSTSPHRKIQMIWKELDLGTPDHNSMIKDIGHVSLDFLVVSMYLLHSI